MNGMNILRCICDETRFSILQILGLEGEMAVGQIARQIGKDQPLVSHHLRILKGCGILRCRTTGRRSLYSLSNMRITLLIADILEAGSRINKLCTESSCGDSQDMCCPQDALPSPQEAGTARYPQTPDM